MKDESTNIAIILPVHELNEVTKGLFDNAIGSVMEQTTKPSEVIIVVPKGSDVSNYMKSYDFKNIKPQVVIAENDGATDFSSQINYGIKTAKADWISILEYDDEYAKIWFKNVVEYRQAYNDVEIFLPIIVDVNSNSEFIGFTNEAVWANSFSEELGVLDNNALLAYQNFNIDGMVFKKSIVEENGGFKSNLKLTFIYEFLLRMTFKAVRVMVIPKFGYKHINQRVGSLFSTYKETIDPAEARWLLSQAKKESYFQKDRIITYVNQNA